MVSAPTTCSPVLQRNAITCSDLSLDLPQDLCTCTSLYLECFSSQRLLVFQPVTAPWLPPQRHLRLSPHPVILFSWLIMMGSPPPRPLFPCNHTLVRNYVSFKHSGRCQRPDPGFQHMTLLLPLWSLTHCLLESHILLSAVCKGMHHDAQPPLLT